MAYADPGLQRLDRVLTNISVGYSNDEFVAPELFPTVRVDQKSDKYTVFERRAFNVYDDIRAPGALASQIPPRALSRDSYYAQEHALVDVVPREEQDASSDDPGVNPLADSTEELTDAILLKREKIAADLATTAANYASGHTVTLSGTSQWSDYGSVSDPIGDMKDGRNVLHAAIVKKPTITVMGFEVASALEDHPDFIERIKYSQKGVSTMSLVAEIADVNRIVVAGAMINSANAGQAVDTDYMWGKHVVIAYVPPRPGMRVPAYGYEFAWRYQRGVRGVAGRDMPVERWYNEDHDADKIRVRRRYDLKHIAVDNATDDNSIGGYLIRAAVA